jgi:hypothetical protein
MLRAALPAVQAAALRASRHPESRALVRELVLTPGGGLQWARLPQLVRLLRGAPDDSVSTKSAAADADAAVHTSTASNHSGRARGSGDDGGAVMAAMAVVAAVLDPSGRGLRRVLLDADGPTVAAELARAPCPSPDPNLSLTYQLRFLSGLDTASLKSPVAQRT